MDTFINAILAIEGSTMWLHLIFIVLHKEQTGITYYFIKLIINVFNMLLNLVTRKVSAL